MRTFRIVLIILGALLAILLLGFGVMNLIYPDVPESYLDKNTRICLMMIFTGLIAVYALFRHLIGGFILSVCALALSFVFNGFFRNPITPVVLACGILFMLHGYLYRRGLKK